MKVSTRNQLKGIVSSIKEGIVNSEVIVNLSESNKIIAIITNGAVNNLALNEGDNVYALIKASNVMVGIDVKHISARNILCGKVSSIIDGAVNTEISIDLGDDCFITSVITKTSAEQLELLVGKEVCAIIKASSVMLAKE